MLQQLNESQISLTQAQTEIDKMEAQKATIKLLKKEKALPAEDYLNSVRHLERCIPNSESCDESTKDYYQRILEGVQSLHETAIRSEVKIDEVENNLEGILKQFNSLYAMLADYKNVSYQQKFDVNQFKVVLNSIEDSTECLKKNYKDLIKLEGYSQSIKFDSDSTKHLGQELSEDDFQEYLKIKNSDEESSRQYDQISEKLEALNKKLYESELKFEESKQKRKELEENRANSRRVLQEREILIREKEKNLLAYAEKVEQLEIEVNREFSSKLLDVESKSERQQEKVMERYNKSSEERDEIRSTLLQQLSGNLTKNPWKHYIFLLDHSESMRKSRWNALEKAVERFVEQNKSQVSDLLSVITFDDTATEIFKKIKFSEYQTPSISTWGGTNFDAAFKMALEISNLSRTHRPIVVFLTDGDGKMKETQNILRQMSVLHKDKGFMFFSVGVGDGFKTGALETITETANYGNRWIDLGNHRIEFLRTTRDERVLEKIFTEIADAMNALEHNIKDAMEMNDKERSKVEEEAKRQYQFNTKMTQQERQTIIDRQKERLERERKILGRRKKEEQSQINFLKKDIEDIHKYIETLDNKLGKESREVVPEDIERLKQEKRNFEEEKERILNLTKGYSANRIKVLEDLQESMKSRNMSTSFQLFDFFKAKERVRSLKDDQQRYLGKMINFVEAIIKQNSSVKESLMSTKLELSHLEEDAVLDIVVDHYKNSVEVNRDQDVPNFRRIANKILEIDGNDGKEQQALQLLINCLHPRSFVCPKTTNEERENSITNYLNKKFKADNESFAQELRYLDEELINSNQKLGQAKEDLQKVNEELETLKEKKPKQERKVKNLKTQINKAKGKDEADKENMKGKRNAGTDDDSDKDDEEEFEKAKEKLLITEKKIEERKASQKIFKEEINSVEKELKEIKSRKFENEKKKLEKERGKEEIKNTILEFHYRLKIELMARVSKYLKEESCKKILTFERSLMMNLIEPLNFYFSQD